MKKSALVGCIFPRVIRTNLKIELPPSMKVAFSISITYAQGLTQARRL